jgi:Fe-S-cluster-containing hydrogenase component 2
VTFVTSAAKDIYRLLLQGDAAKRKRRETLLRSVGIDETFFDEGRVMIDVATCRGVECKLCIEACPTHALYRANGEVKLEAELCIYCTACVLSCIVDDCIVVTRRRSNGDREQFSRPIEAVRLLNQRAAHRRVEKLSEHTSEAAQMR